jgi:hypothetical protein
VIVGILCTQDLYWFLSGAFMLIYMFPHVAGPVTRQEYSLEYGTDCIEMHVGAIEKNERLVLIDYLIASGGTLGAAIKLLGMMLFPSFGSRLIQGNHFVAVRF